MKMSGVRWLVVGLIAFATVINYIDRNALAVMWPEISEDLGLTKQDYALLITFFMVSYAIGQAVFGRLFDAIGTRLGFVLSIGVWSIAIALHALARGVYSLGAARALLGVSEAGAWPGAVKANAEWFPAKERAFAQGIFNAGASLGAVLSAPVIAYLFLLLHWQATFVLIGVLGLLWIIPWLFIYRAGPDRHPWVTPEERAHILDRDAAVASAPTETGYAPGVLGLLKHKESWAIILSRFFVDSVWWLFISWLPIYLADTFGFDIKQIGLFAWVPYVGAAAGSLLGGWFSGRMIKSGMSVGRARKTAITIGCLIMVPTLLATSVAADPLTAVLLIACVLFGFQIAIGNIQTLPSDYFSGKSVGSLAGVAGMAAVFGVLITTWTVPAITEQSYAPVFVIGAALPILSLIAIFALGGRVRRIEAPSMQGDVA